MKNKILATRRIFAISLITFVLSANLTTLKAQISVIVSKSSTCAANKNEAKDMFLGVKATWSNGNKVKIVDQPDTEIGKNFYNSFLGKSINQVRMQWTKLVLSGQASAPGKAANDEDVKKYVSENPYAIGFISSQSLDKSVKELFKIE